MYAALTVRKLKPGTYDEWRRAWEPDEWPEGSQKAYILRNVQDPEEVIAFGFFEQNLEDLKSDRDFVRQMDERVERMAPHIDSIGADGIYEVVEEVVPSGTTSSVAGPRA
jgi:hypothetical protein